MFAGHVGPTLESGKYRATGKFASALSPSNHFQVENDGLKLDLPQMNLATAAS